MLDRNIIMGLLKEKEFSKIVNYFSDEYMSILINFLNNNNVEITDEDTINDLMYKVEINFPKYSGLMMLLSMTLFNEDITMGDRIESLIDNYNIIKERLT